MQNKLSLRNVTLIALIGLFSMHFMTACGRASQSSTNSNTPTSTLPQSTPSPTAQPIQNTTATVVPEKLMITVSQTTYNPSDTIVLSIANGLSESIFVTPYHTNCTPVVLEREVQNNWIVVGNCTREQTPHAVSIQSGTITQLRFSPFISTPKPNANAQWQPGIYRASLTYTTSPDPDTYNAHGTLIRSDPFTVV